MKTNKNIFGFLTALSLLVLLVSWKSADKIDPALAYSGEQLFRDVVFFESQKMQEDISEYTRFKSIAEERGSSTGKSFEDFKDFTINFIKESDPGYFSKFATIIQGNDPYQIKQLLTSSLSVVSISQIVFQSDLKERNDYINLISSQDFTNTDNILQDLKNVINEYKTNNPNYKKAELTAAPLIYQPDIPDLVFAYFPPCSIVAVCAVIYYMDAKTSTEESHLLTENITNSIIKNY